MHLFTRSRKQILQTKPNDFNILSLPKSCIISAGEKTLVHVQLGRAT